MSRISYRNYPILEKIKNKSLGVVPVRSVDALNFQENHLRINHLFKTHAEKFGTSIKVVSENFVKTAFGAKDRLIYLADKDVLETGYRKAGTLIFGNVVLMYELESDEVNTYFTVFKMDKDGMFDYISTNRDGESAFTMCSGVEYHKTKDSLLEVGQQLKTIICLINMFIDYAEVEEVESKARTKIHAQGCRYLNETDLDIGYLDSKWFTSLVNSKGFKVGGHFRLQPKKKDGEWTKELIWINDFEKKGYSRKAGILNTNELT